MAAGPDPNRWSPTDPETTGGELGDPRSTRLGTPSWLTALIVAVVALALLAVFFF
jgi:hypothetical protein